MEVCCLSLVVIITNNVCWIVMQFIYTGKGFFEKTEADSNYITEHPRDDISNLYLCTVCHKRFTVKGL